jgi:hypothetical protein
MNQYTDTSVNEACLKHVKLSQGYMCASASVREREREREREKEREGEEREGSTRKKRERENADTYTHAQTIREVGERECEKETHKDGEEGDRRDKERTSLYINLRILPRHAHMNTPAVSAGGLLQHPSLHRLNRLSLHRAMPPTSPLAGQVGRRMPVSSPPAPSGAPSSCSPTPSSSRPLSTAICGALPFIWLQAVVQS